MNTRRFPPDACVAYLCCQTGLTEDAIRTLLQMEKISSVFLRAQVKAWEDGYSCANGFGVETPRLREASALCLKPGHAEENLPIRAAWLSRHKGLWEVEPKKIVKIMKTAGLFSKTVYPGDVNIKRILSIAKQLARRKSFKNPKRKDKSK